MREENYDNLRRALDQLPSYDPSSLNWDGIERRINEEEEPTEAAKVLPAYAPPSKVWNKLNGQLDQRRKQRHQLKLVYRWVARAAIVVMVFGAGYFSATYDSGPKVSYAFSEEKPSEANFISIDANEEEARFDRLMEQLSAIDEPELNALRLELEELTAAKKEVEEMLAAYGRDNDIIQQLVEIETERSRVYRRAYAEI